MKAIRFLLFPFAILYDLITSLRNIFYNKGIFKSTEFDLPVIAVGNLNVGGTGKSPQIEYLIRLLQDQYKIAVLSRGYKRKTEGFVQINSDHTAEDVGDEPLQFFKKFSKISVVVDANRVNGIQRLQKEEQPDVILLDDAFQHRKVKAGFYVLLTKYGDLFTDDFLLPTGNLRESRRGSKRADAIIVTKCPKDISKNEKQGILKKLNAKEGQQVFFSTISYHPKTKGFQKVAIENLREYEIVLVTGIANPKPLLNFLDEQQCKVQHLKYADHHHFNEQEIQTIQNTFDQLTSDKKILLTTEKDFMRLSDTISELSYIEIESTFLENSIEFNQQILAYCNTNS